jgi:hypothetical protein
VACHPEEMVAVRKGSCLWVTAAMAAEVVVVAVVAVVVVVAAALAQKVMVESGAEQKVMDWKVTATVETPCSAWQMGSWPICSVS